ASKLMFWMSNLLPLPVSRSLRPFSNGSWGSTRRCLPDSFHQSKFRCDQAGVPHLDEDYLILSTIHSAKGQEWKSVFLLNTVDGCLPSDLATGTPAEIEEERRLLYVAMTRAKDNLHLIVPQRFFAHSQQSNGDRHMYASRTRFIPADILDNFQGCAWPVAAVPAKGHHAGSP